MSFKNYHIPLDFGGLISSESGHQEVKKPSDLLIKRTDSVKKSVDEHLELLLTTHRGEYKFNWDYGFVIWDSEFENIDIEKFNTHNYPKQDIEEKLKKLISRYEPRLKGIQVEIFFIYKKNFRGRRIKYFVDLKIKGAIAGKIDEPYEKSFQFAMGPFLK